uniref:Zinc finger protein n=1 Tax=Schizaphis graminum TaxID=13262 RepID=A0A2S2NDC4_SCHGA
MDNNLKCKECNKTFSLNKSLYAHSRKFHGIELVAPKIQNYNCEYCDKKYSKERYLSEHLQNIHGTRISKKSTRIICPYDACEERLYSFVKLRSHLSEIHQTDVELEEFTFDTISGMYIDCFYYYLNKLP